jgi:hypothetical protein
MEPMSIAAANVAPNFGFRRSLTASELQRVEEPCVIMEFESRDSDDSPFWVYTIGGLLDGKPLPGCTVAGDVITISGVDTREQADGMASMGLFDTLQALDDELKKYTAGQDALRRLSSIGAVDRLDLATRKDADKSDAFERDRQLIEPLKGDDILLAAGEVVGKEGAH